MPEQVKQPNPWRKIMMMMMTNNEEKDSSQSQRIAVMNKKVLW
jgi:hypothetical protein